MKTLLLIFALIQSITLLAQTSTNDDFKVIKDTIIVAPELNGDMDTSNYYMMPELIHIRAAREEQIEVNGVLETRKIPAEYKTVYIKFFPFKNILDTKNASHVIPREILIIDRWVPKNEIPF